MITNAERAKNHAKQLLVHYFRLAGAVHDSDNVVEIEEIVDFIFYAAVSQAAAERYVISAEDAAKA